MARIRRQARAEALVRYGPERSALNEMLRQALEDRDAAIHAAAGAERGMQAAISKARPEVSRSFGRTLEEAKAGSATTDDILRGIGPAADPFRAAIARERGSGERRLGETLANALKELSDRRVEAAAGRAFATSNAQSRYQGEVGKVRRRALDLAREEGAFTQGRTGELRKEAADRSFKAEQERIEREFKADQNAADRSIDRARLGETERHHRASERNAARKDRRERANAKPPSSADRRAWGKAYDSINEARGYFRKLGGNLKPTQIKPLLVTGHTTEGGTKIPKFAAVYVDAAEELERKGKLSAGTIRALRTRGIRVPAKWLPRRPRPVRSPGANEGGRGRPTNWG